MASTVDVVVRFLTDSSKVSDDMGKVKASGDRLMGWAKAAVGAVGAVFAVKTVSDWVGAAEEAESVSIGLAKVLRNAGDATGEWAKHSEDLASALQNKTGIDDEVIKRGQTILGTFHSVAGAVGQQTGAWDRATKAALDLSKAGFGSVDSAATMLGKALEDPKKGLTALAKAGVSFEPEQRKLIEGFVASGDKAGAMNAILQAVEGQVGGVAEATATSSDKMSAAWGDTQEALGGLLLPVLQELAPILGDAAHWIQDVMVPALNDHLGPALDTIASFIQNDLVPWLGDKLGKVIEAVAGWVTGTLVPALQDLAGWWSDNRDAIMGALNPFIEVGKVILKIAAAAAVLAGILISKLFPILGDIGSWMTDNQEIFGAIAIALGVMGAALLISVVPAFLSWAAAMLIAAANAVIMWAATMGPILLIGAAITALAFLIIKNWDTIKAVALAVWDAILGAVQWLWDWISSNWPLLLAILTGPFGLAVKWILDNWDAITTFFGNIPGWLATALGAVVDAITWPFRWAWDQVVNLWNGIAGFFGQIPGWIGDALSSLGGIILAPFSWAWDQIIAIKDKIVGIGSQIVDGIKAPWNAFANWFNGLSITIGGQELPGPIPDIPSITLDLPDIPTFAKGGIVTRPTLALVGEAGPEAIMPLAQAQGRAGPVVVIENATFTEPMDVDLFMRQAAWHARAAGL